MKVLQYFLTYCLFVICLLAVSCGSGKDHRNPNPSLDEFGPSDDGGKGTSAVKILPGSLYNSLDPGALSVQWTKQNGQPVATIETDAVTDLRALYLRIELPDGVAGNPSVSSADWAGDDALSIAVPSGNSTLDIGICKLHPGSATGFSGSTSLVTVRFHDAETSASPQRTAASAPVTAASQIDMDYSPLANQLRWLYRSQGDYDQNGLVSISDLTPIAIHFGKSSGGGEFNETSIESVVDGDGNGEINIADISPIAINFGNAIQSFNIYRGAANNYPIGALGPSPTAPVDSKPFSKAEGNPATGRLRFEQTAIAPPNLVDGHWLRPVDNGEEGIASLVAGLGNQLPIADLQINRNVGIAPLQLEADAGNSTDPEGGPLEYFLAVYDVNDPPTEYPAPSGPTLSEELGVGNYGVFLLVRDEDGAENFAGASVSVVAGTGWVINEIDNFRGLYAFDNFFDVALQGIGESPHVAVAFKDGLASRITMGSDSLALGADFGDFSSVYSEASNAGTEVVMLDVNGAPCVFSQQTRAADSVVRFTNMSDLNNPVGTSLSDGFDTYSDISSAMIGGLPTVAFHNEDDGDLIYAVASNSDGTAWENPVVIVSSGDTGEQTSIASINGLPAITYYNPAALRVRYIDAFLNGGTLTWNPPMSIVADPTSRMFDSLLELPNGDPWMMYHASSNAEFRTLSGSGFLQNSVATTTSGNATNSFSTAVIGERVCIVWHDTSDLSLKFIRSLDETGTSWSVPEKITDITTIINPSISDVGGYVAIAYVDTLLNKLFYAILIEE